MSMPVAQLPPATKPGVAIFVYECVSGAPGHRFYAVAFPPNRMPVYAYDDERGLVESRVKGLLNANR